MFPGPSSGSHGAGGLATSWNIAILLAILIGTIGMWWWQPLGWTCLLLVVAPLGLSMKGTTSRLQWTARLRRLAVLSALISLLVVAASLITGDPGWTVALSVSIPLVVDLSLAIMAPIERALGERWVTSGASQAGLLRCPRRSDHRQLRQDDYQRLRAASAIESHDHGEHSGVVQQPDGSRPRHQRASHPRDRNLRGRDGHLRQGRDRGAL